MYSIFYKTLIYKVPQHLLPTQTSQEQNGSHEIDLKKQYIIVFTRSFSPTLHGGSETNLTSLYKRELHKQDGKLSSRRPN